MTTVLLLSGGTGTRMGGGALPKQYLSVCGKPIIVYSLYTLDRHPLVDRFVIAAAPVWREKIDEWRIAEGIAKPVIYADPGETRQLSILNGLSAMADTASDDETVIIHDAARPLVSAELITRCVRALGSCDGVMPTLPAKDTFYLLDDTGRASKLLPRSQLAAGQAPEVFRFAPYYRACREASREELLTVSGTTEMALRHGLKVTTVAGDERNLKITTPNDLLLLQAYMEETKR